MSNKLQVRESQKVEYKSEFDDFNKVVIKGKIQTPFVFSHLIDREPYYETKVQIKSAYRKPVYIMVKAPWSMIKNKVECRNVKDLPIKVTGKLRSYLTKRDNKKETGVYLLASTICIGEEDNEGTYIDSNNFVFLEGVIVRDVYTKNTEVGKKKSDFTLAVERDGSRKKDFIPCIIFEEIFSKNVLQRGNRVRFTGSICSRQFFKPNKEEPSIGEYKEVVEVSIVGISKV